ncbi:right-handed parallel beta-helix repeat-containing protein, partial [Candidatus Bathyarchaeota archaeon]|nr:right-handed parallel beta-helix repeat-containing protein [Candidatus Bathyarchaeota archaeon]
FKRLMLLELYKLLWENVSQWEQETGREFYISTRVGLPGWFVDLPFLQYVDGINWEYCWFSAAAFGDRPDIIGYPNRTASTDFRVLQSLGKRFNPWITPASSRDQTGFSEWFSYGWNMTKDPEEQYIALAEIIVCGGLPSVKWGDEGQAVNATHWKQFTKLVQEKPQLFGQSQFGEIALIYPAATALNWYKLNFTSLLPYGAYAGYDGYEGTYYLLADSHRVFDIIVFGDNMWVNITHPLSELLKYRAVVLPMALCLTDDQVELLEQYLQSGGIIIALGDVGLYNEHVEPVNREFSNYFDGQVHQVGNGLIISIKDISPIEYLGYRTKYDSRAVPILEQFRQRVDAYLPRAVNTGLAPRAHIYRFFNYDENAMIFHIINFVYDFEQDKVVRAYNVSFNFTLPSQLQGEEVSVWVYSEDMPEGMEVPHSQDGETISITIPKVSILTSIEVRPHFEVPEPLVINEPTELRDGTYTFNRSLIVNSSFSIVNSQVEIRGGVKPIKIEVLPGGSLTIINSTIYKATGNYYIVARKGSSVFISGSDISGAGLFGPLERGGICIETEGAVILNSKIHNNYDYGLLLFNANYSVIANNEFYGNALAISILDSSFVEFDNNTVRDNYAGVLVRSSGVEIGIAELCRMYERGVLPPRGAVKQTISNCRIINNHFVNVMLSGTNFATIVNSECSNASAMNILVYRSIAKVFNCSIHSGWIGALIYESPIVTFTGNRVYNHSHIGLKIYKCCSMGILHWLHLEPIAAYSDEGDVRIIGNRFENNEYGIHIDFEGGPTGYFNRHIRISDDAFMHNSVGIFVNRAVGEVIRNNFIDNNKHLDGGKYGPLPAFSINNSNCVGNYWDTYSGDGPYEVLPGCYDYCPLTEPIEIPTITDCEGPSVRVENCRILQFNETHVVITFDLYASDEESYLGDVYLRTHFGFVGLLSPNMQEREFGWIGFTVGAPGSEYPTKSYTIYNFTFVYGWTAEMEPVPFPKKWVENATLTVYMTDTWGNWNKNDTAAPYVKIVSRAPETVYEDDPVTLYILVSDWSEISNVTLRYFDGSAWYTADANFDETTHLYYAVIPPRTPGTIIKYAVYAEDAYGNDATYTDEYCTYEVVPEYPLNIMTLILLALASASIILTKNRLKKSLKSLL